MIDLHAFWKAILRQDAKALRTFFDERAVVRWPNTNEQFTAAEFIHANCAYPGEWDGQIQRIEKTGECTITVTHVFSKEGNDSFHVVSFIDQRNDKIVSMDEYWGDDGMAPQWRSDLKIGKPIDGPI